MTPLMETVETEQARVDAHGGDRGLRAIERARRSVPWWLAAAIVVLPLAFAVVTLLTNVGAPYHPVGDWASIELQVRDVYRHPVLVGLFSRAEWHHPGAAFFYLLAIPYRLLGSTSSAIDIGALLINGASIVAVAWLARRRGGTALMWCTLVGLSALVRALGIDYLRSPWNPSLPVLPFAVFLFLVWCMLDGDGWAVPAAAAVATFCVQTHIGFGLLAVPLLVVGFVGYVRTRRALRRPLVITTVVLFIAWLPPTIDQVHGTGNFSSILDYFGNTRDRPHPFPTAWRIVTGEFGWPPEWIAGARPQHLFLIGVHPFVHHAPFPFLLAAFGIAVLALWRWCDTGALKYVAILVGALVLGIVSVMRTLGPIEAYRLRWTWVIATLAMTVVAWTAWRAAAHRWHWIEASVLVPVSIALIGALAVVNTLDAIHPTAPDPSDIYSMMQVLAPQIAQNLPDGNGVVVVRYSTMGGQFWWEPAIVLELELHNVPVVVDHDPIRLVGEHRLYRGGPIRTVLTIVDGTDALSDPPGSRLVAFWGLEPRDQLRRDYFEGQVLDSEHARDQISDRDYFTRRLHLPTADTAVAIYAS